MHVEYTKRFLKDLASLPLHVRIEIEKFVFEVIPDASDFYAIKKFESMRGYPNYFKARFGDYRIGVMYQNHVLIFMRVLHRKEIYRFFP